MKTLLLALLLSQNTPRHPSPATVNTVPVGNGTNWVTTAVPACSGTNSALTFNNGTGLFGCNSITVDGGTLGVTTITGTSPVVTVPDGGGGYNVSLSTVPVSVGGTALTATGDDEIPIGSNSSTYVSTVIPSTKSTGSGIDVLQYDDVSNQFAAYRLKRHVWSTLCLGNASYCGDAGSPFLSYLGDKTSAWKLRQVSCTPSAAATVAPVGSLVVTVFDVDANAAVDSCAIVCNTISVTGAACNLSATTTAGNRLRVYATGCGTLSGGGGDPNGFPTNLWCNITMEGAP